MVILAHILHVVCRFIGNWARVIHFGQNKYWSILTGARARNFAQIRSKPINACNVHNFKFTYIKSASYDNLQCSTTV